MYNTCHSLLVTRSRNPRKPAYIFFLKVECIRYKVSYRVWCRANRPSEVLKAGTGMLPVPPCLFLWNPMVSYLLLSTSLPHFSPSPLSFIASSCMWKNLHQHFQVHRSSFRAAVVSLKLHIPGRKFGSRAWLKGSEMEKKTRLPGPGATGRPGRRLLSWSKE